MTPDNFFNQRFGDRVKEMTNDEMIQALRGLVETDGWIAILKYHRARKEMAQNMLYAIDPVKEPTQIARTQGMLSGLSDLEDAVFRLSKPPVEEEGSKDQQG